uniref:RBR-type E3 ubiquitin transferase n=1 Tax=Steinernema glaseri TaxID=37863 RepID=A0A1I7Y736_9BILA
MKTLCLGSRGSMDFDDDAAFSGSDIESDNECPSDDDGIVMQAVSGSEDGGGRGDSDRDFQILAQEQLIPEMEQIISDVNTIVGLPPTICRILLHRFKWNRESLLERYYENTDNQQKFYKDAGIRCPITSGVGKERREAVALGTCGICCDQSALVGLECAHKFCSDCWENYLTQKVKDNSDAYLTCPAFKCEYAVDDDTVFSYFASNQPMEKRYRKLIMYSFVESNRLLKWCPGADCGKVIKVQHFEARPVTCDCGMTFCFECSHEWHEPVNCRLLRLWAKKCSDDSETANWINANTKECPKCQVTIEKDGGCNHMTCKNSACKAEFCWMCLGPWEPHGSAWYSCNRFDDSAAKQARDAQERSRAALQRYLHYYNRFINHQHSLKLENKLYSMVENKMEQMQQANFSWIEVQYLRKAVDVLGECRRTLMYTYAFAYYLERDNQTVIFEDNQRDLEHATEQLSEFLERDLENEDLVTLKQRVQDKYRYVEQRRQVLLKHCAEGTERDTWRYTVQF